MASLSAVVTTIQEPTGSVQRLSQELARTGSNLIVIGDRKGPRTFHQCDALFYSIDRQKDLPFGLAMALPEGHYSRKNLGYLLAIKQQAGSIYESDDDNCPLDNWSPRERQAQAVGMGKRGWVNIYKCFSDDLMWPRGLPLDAISEPLEGVDCLEPVGNVLAPIQQGLANGAPDADAIWYLLREKEVVFKDGPSVYLPPGSWCPFNSQSTWWWPEAYPLMYLPSYCSFRMTDIWRSFIAQRCLWEMGYGLVFHAPEVYQQRNPHDLMRDFKDEVPGYLRNAEMAILLEKLSLSSGTENAGANLRWCYEALVEAEFFPPLELKLVDIWLKDLYGINSSS